jgi:hypothetical protein
MYFKEFLIYKLKFFEREIIGIQISSLKITTLKK